MKLRRVCLGIAVLGLVIATSAGATDSVQAAPAPRLCSEAPCWGLYSAQDLLPEAASCAEARRAEGLSFRRRLFPSNGAPGLVGSGRNAAGAKRFRAAF
jgi:hypothetical protein